MTLWCLFWRKPCNSKGAISFYMIRICIFCRYMLSRAGIPRHAIIKKFADDEISQLEDVISVLSKLCKGDRVPLEYISYRDRHRRKVCIKCADVQHDIACTVFFFVFWLCRFKKSNLWWIDSCKLYHITWKWKTYLSILHENERLTFHFHKSIN
jgi:hypothetical protein